MKELSARFSQSPIAKLSCIVASDRDEADTWIQLIHRGQQQGAGVVVWDGLVAARYDARRQNKANFTLEALDFVRVTPLSPKQLSIELITVTFPITNLERVINTPYVRNKLGIDEG